VKKDVKDSGDESKWTKVDEELLSEEPMKTKMRISPQLLKEPSPTGEPQTRGKRPQSMFIAPKTSYFKLPERIIKPLNTKATNSHLTGSQELLHSETSKQTGSPSNVFPTTIETGPSQSSIESKRKPAGGRSLLSLLEADGGKQPNLIANRTGSPERPFRGVGDLIQRWQTLSQNR